jgi:DNA-binding NtrC family response regulator
LTFPVRSSNSNKYGGFSLSNSDHFANYYIKKKNDNSPRTGVALRENTKGGGFDKDQHRTRLLIVDDEYDIVHVLKLGLQQNGFLVEGFTNPEEALQSFKSNAESYCLLLSDVRMPGLTGIQLARKVKEINPNVKVVLMTAFEIRVDEFSTVFPSTKVDGFVQKPVGIRELTDKVLSIIGQSKGEEK